MSAISVCDVTLSYDNLTVAEHVSFDIEFGDYVCIVGENGTGKSTLLKALVGIHQPKHGHILYDCDIKNGDIGYLPQQTVVRNDFPASVEEIVRSGCLGLLGKRPFLSSEEDHDHIFRMCGSALRTVGKTIVSDGMAGGIL